MAEQKNSYEYKGDVQVVQGAINKNMQLAPLDEGTPFNAATVDNCLEFMLDCAMRAEPEAMVSIHCPEVNGVGTIAKGPHTVASIRAFKKKNPSASAKLQNGQKDGNPYIGLYHPNSPSMSNRKKNKVF